MAYTTIIYSYLKANCFWKCWLSLESLAFWERELFFVMISSYECHFLYKYHWFLCFEKKKTEGGAPFRVKLAAKKNLKSLQGHFQILLSLLHTIWLPYHLVGIIGIKDITFFFLILVLFLKGDINDKNHMVVGTRALISAFKHCCNNMH